MVKSNLKLASVTKVAGSRPAEYLNWSNWVIKISSNINCLHFINTAAKMVIFGKFYGLNFAR